MCGIYGIIVREKTTVSAHFIRDSLEFIAKASIARGKDSSGIVFKNTQSQEIHCVKGDIAVNKLLKTREYRQNLTRSLSSYSSGFAFQAMGHARLVTNGSQLRPHNNQPVVKDGVIGIHNGIIVNVDKLWLVHPHLVRKYEIDTEILLSMIKDGLNKSDSHKVAVSKAVQASEGTVSAAVYFDDCSLLVLTSNSGSLYYIITNDILIFASEHAYLSAYIRKFLKPDVKCIQLKARSTLVFDISSFREFEKEPAESSDVGDYIKHRPFAIKEYNIVGPARHEIVIDAVRFKHNQNERYLLQLSQADDNAIKALKRCTKCILPETFPFISFDAAGVCTYCANYRPKNQIHSPESLLEKLEPYRRAGGQPDCLIPFSGGRDSTYTLHYLKKELGFNPIAFTYDWGMVTDLARRNAARVCGKLGVENIIVAADIRLKRKNIKLNIEAWLKKPHLGMVPLFMAGDKYFFYYCNKLLQENDLQVSIWGSNPLENTDFKSGFTGVKPAFDKKRIDDLNLLNKIRLGTFFTKNFLGNTAYLNTSVFDTLGAFSSRYLIKRRGYLQLFDYIKWDEKVIDNLLLNEYNWERSPDNRSTWRIGDGTAAFYNYIYYTVAGFSEFDTFRSNQIREGQLSRSAALNLAQSENIPRYESLRWYLEILGMDFKSTVQQINNIPKFYAR